MEQRCHLGMVWLTWLGLPFLALMVGWRGGLAAGLVVLAAGVVGQLLYVRWFPRISRLMGYGPVEDTAAPAGSLAAPPPRVTLYTATVCPFCPIVKRRLAALQREVPFEIDEVDVTFHPEVVRTKGLRSVPAIEANGRLLVGNATSADIAAFLNAAPAGPADMAAGLSQRRQ